MDALPPLDLHAIEEDFLRNADASRRRRLGQFFTPRGVARGMARWTGRGRRPATLLDPAAGAGVFLREAALLPGDGTAAWTGYDIDAGVLEHGRPHLPPGCELRCADFLRAEVGARFDAVVCNPPYLKHHQLDGKAEIADLLRRQTGVALPLSSNAYCLFLVKAAHLLADGGRLAFIVPSEFLNADYGVAVKTFLKDSGWLRAILQFDFTTQVFDAALTTACIVLLERARADKPPVFVHLTDPALLADAFAAVDDPGASRLPGVFRINAEWLDPARKWRNYFEAGRGQADLFSLPLSHYARCRRGIATGDNAYFTLSDAETEANGVRPASVRPCVARAADARQLVFGEAQFAALRAQGRKAWLMHFSEPLSDGERAYLARGEALGVPDKYLPSHRPVWHLPENRPPADLWVQVFSRQGARFILNKAQALNLTCFHGLYLTEAGKPFRMALFAYLNTVYAQERMREERREYGAGLEKFEPKDIERVRVPDFAAMDDELLEALSLFGEAIAARPDDAAQVGERLKQADQMLREWGNR